MMRIGIIGAGLMGRWHAHAATRLGMTVVGVADVDRERRTAMAGRYRGARASADAGAMLQAERIDVVHICTPLPTHAQLTRIAIDAGIHALVEKPLAATAETTRALLEAAERAGIMVCPVHQAAFQNGVEHARAALARLGAVCRISFDICSAGGRPPVGARRGDRSADGGDLDAVLGDILPHPLSVLRQLWPDTVWDAALWSVEHPAQGELLVVGRHAGALLSIAISMHGRPTCFEMSVQCTGGTVRLDLFHGFCTVHDGRVSRFRKAARPFTDAVASFGAAASNLSRRAIEREPAYPGLRRLVRGFYAAAATGQACPISPKDVIAVASARDMIQARMSRVLPSRSACGERPLQKLG